MSSLWNHEGHDSKSCSMLLIKASELVITSRKRNCCNNGKAQDTDSLESLKYN